MTKLSVNINKIATLRNARGGNIPDLLKVAQDCESFGADGITVHPRPDERHIRIKDVYDLKGRVKTEFNIEGYPSPDFIKLIKSIDGVSISINHETSLQAGYLITTSCLRFCGDSDCYRVIYKSPSRCHYDSCPSLYPIKYEY